MGQMLYMLAEVANKHALKEIADILYSAFSQEQADTAEFDHPFNKSALLALFYNRGPKWVISELTSLIKAAQKGAPLTYPHIFNAEGAPAHQTQIDYLQELLDDLAGIASKPRQLENVLGRKLTHVRSRPAGNAPLFLKTPLPARDQDRKRRGK
jgi:hypothetical protein